MIIVCIRGRLGNQLFQVALGMHLEKRGQLVKYDLSATESGKVAVLSFPPLNEYLEARVIKSTKFFLAPFGRLGRIARFIWKINRYYGNINVYFIWVCYDNEKCLGRSSRTINTRFVLSSRNKNRTH